MRFPQNLTAAETSDYTTLRDNVTWYGSGRRGEDKMSNGLELLDPAQEERLRPVWDEEADNGVDDPYVVILYNDDYHDMGAVMEQIQRATGYDIERCIRIMFEAHTQGRAIAYTGSEADCERAARILRQIGLQVETDRF